MAIVRAPRVEARATAKRTTESSSSSSSESWEVPAKPATPEQTVEAFALGIPTLLGVRFNHKLCTCNQSFFYKFAIYPESTHDSFNRVFSLKILDWLKSLFVFFVFFFLLCE